ncbi:MAG: hypothetical protein RI952_1169 [Bacteroidota bacterium]|jgi:predicted Zn-dependent peptidase
MKIDRTTAPAAFELKNIPVIPAKEHLFANGMKLHYINGGSEELMRIEFIFDAGTNREPKPLIANACNFLLNAGTSKSSSVELMEQIDFYGAYFQQDVTFDKASITLYTLNKYLSETLTIVLDILTNSVFPAEEIKTYQENTKQRLAINLEKNDFLAKRNFNNLLFGNQHPYGKMLTSRDCDELNQADLIHFFNENYHLANCKIIAAGLITEREIQLIDEAISKLPNDPKVLPSLPLIESKEAQKFYFEKENALQSAIRIGKLIGNKTHPDYIELIVLNTILGGYFGSRLMANIREDKGYTYGIGSGIASTIDTGFFFITTEVGVDVCESALKEIYIEIDKLKTELVPNEELNLVKNYLLGTYLGSIENVFSYADKFKGIYPYGLDYSYYNEYFNKVKTINSQRIMDLANKYFVSGTLTEVVVGKK